MMMNANLNSLELKNDIGRDGNINKPATDGTFMRFLLIMFCCAKIAYMDMRMKTHHGRAHEDQQVSYGSMVSSFPSIWNTFIILSSFT